MENLEEKIKLIKKDETLKQILGLIKDLLESEPILHAGSTQPKINALMEHYNNRLEALRLVYDIEGCRIGNALI